MGLGPTEAEFMLAEHRYKPIDGTLLTISRQTIAMSPDFAKHLVTSAGLPLRSEALVSLDDKTLGHTLKDMDLISDDSFYALFSGAKLSILDVSDYEGADVIHDMNLPIGPELENRYDFVMCGSCLDNIFDPVTALRNVARLTKPGGRIFLFEWGNAFTTSYLRFTPEWFVDYFAVNGFSDVKSYLLHYPNLDGQERFTGGTVTDVYHYDPLVSGDGPPRYEPSAPQSLRFTMNFVIAEKGPDSTWDRTPIQAAHRMTEAERRPYIEAAARYQKSPRPLFRRGGVRPVGGDAALSRNGTLRSVASWVAGEPL